MPAQEPLIKEARYLVRLANTSYSPVDRHALLERVRRRVSPLGCTAMNLRVSGRAIEFDVFSGPDKNLAGWIDALKPLGDVLTCKRLDVAPPPQTPKQIVSEARALFNEERYWEVHEVLEALWKTAKGPEKEMIQGLILTAAALVHVQKDEIPVAEKMFADAARRLRDTAKDFHGWNVERSLRDLSTVLETKEIIFSKI
jgi:hypothetical protein